MDESRPEIYNAELSHLHLKRFTFWEEQRKKIEIINELGAACIDESQNKEELNRALELYPGR